MKRMICLILAAVLCVGLLAACGSRDSKNSPSSKKPDNKESVEPKIEDILAAELKGTWSAEDNGDTVKIAFRDGGKGEIVADFADAQLGSASYDFTWSVDGDEVLTVILEENATTFRHAKNAMDGKETSWYIDGDTLYYGGIALTKQG